MPVTLTCCYCQKEYTGKKHKRHKNNFCSPGCSQKYQSETQSDIYSLFRYILSQAKHHAKRKFLEFLLTVQFLKFLWEKQDGCCALSGIRLKIGNTVKERRSSANTASLDRIDSSKGYTEDNTQYIHKELQDIKSALPHGYLVEWACLIADHHRGCDNSNKEAPSLDNYATVCYTGPVNDNDPNFVPF